ncbi:hypothetical protein DERP_012481 [Dermatophagoides pteronyssinus]|uniref:Uncharacterized protein n=1 Tax=Dermatophagoides pteronyssinus TaxID=6956 RepID=A0ABQ8IX60_DERPT|nr:hypothetical protein DERP_012481 [Dermatophagoides pteronyssinus]
MPTSCKCLIRLSMTILLLLLLIILIAFYLIITFKSSSSFSSTKIDNDLNSSTFFNIGNNSKTDDRKVEFEEFCLPVRKNDSYLGEEFLSQLRNETVCKDIDWEKFSRKFKIHYGDNDGGEIFIHRYDDNDDDDDEIKMILLIKFPANSLRIFEWKQQSNRKYRYVVQIENNLLMEPKIDSDDYDYDQNELNMANNKHNDNKLEYWANRLLIWNMSTIVLIRYESNADHICRINFNQQKNQFWKCI